MVYQHLVQQSKVSQMQTNITCLILRLAIHSFGAQHARPLELENTQQDLAAISQPTWIWVSMALHFQNQPAHLRVQTSAVLLSAVKSTPQSYASVMLTVNTSMSMGLIKSPKTTGCTTKTQHMASLAWDQVALSGKDLLTQSLDWPSTQSNLQEFPLPQVFLVQQKLNQAISLLARQIMRPISDNQV